MKKCYNKSNLTRLYKGSDRYMPKKISVGISNFKELIENNYYLIDKSLLIKEFLNDGAKIILTPRPRRFGKTLNLSMLKYFFDINTMEESKCLFKGLNIEKEEEFKYQGEFPVIFVTFKDIKYSSYSEFKNGMRILMSELYSNYSNIMESNKLSDVDRKFFNDIWNEKASDEHITKAISKLMYFLYKY